MRFDNDGDFFTDLYMSGAFDNKKSSKSGGGCLGAFLLIITLPVLPVIGVILLMS